jgi:cytochrome b6-f complex subunit 7
MRQPVFGVTWHRQSGTVLGNVEQIMGSEIFSTSILLSTLVLVGLGAGFVLLRLQGGEE